MDHEIIWNVAWERHVLPGGHALNSGGEARLLLRLQQVSVWQHLQQLVCQGSRSVGVCSAICATQRALCFTFSTNHSHH